MWQTLGYSITFLFSEGPSPFQKISVGSLNESILKQVGLRATPWVKLAKPVLNFRKAGKKNEYYTF